MGAVFAILQMLTTYISELQQLQPPGTCILQGPADTALPQLQKLQEQLTAVTGEWQGVLSAWQSSAELLLRMMADAASHGENCSSLNWAMQLQQLLRGSVHKDEATALRDLGAAVCVEFPVTLCCNNPGCTSMAKVSEMRLGSLCKGCGVAKYCSKECQAVAWKMGHNKVCKRITKATAAAPAGAA